MRSGFVTDLPVSSNPIREPDVRRILMPALSAILVNAGMSWSQTPAPVPVPTGPVASVVTTAEPSVLVGGGGGSTDAPRIWGSTEYLLWWVRDARVPTVTSFADPAKALAAGLFPGALGAPGTTFLNSGKQDYGGIPGGRLTVGGWLDSENSLGFEASGFLMSQRTNNFSVYSNAGGPPFISLPVTIVPGNIQEALNLSDPGISQGGTTIATTVNIWGTEANGILAAWNSGAIRAKALVGFRYLDISESLNISNTTVESFLGETESAVFNDSFHTRNQIYAGQIGGQVEATYGRFFVNLLGKAAFGVDHESLNVGGSTTATITIPGAGTLRESAPGGIYALGTNSGRRLQDEFVFVPELHLQLGMNLTPLIRVYAGYEFLYVSDVVRPGQQVDTTLNPSQLFGAKLVGEPRPAPMFNHSDMWMQGVSAGLEIRF
jgi:Putative beta barrel porin-7 (BBP7)